MIERFNLTLLPSILLAFVQVQASGAELEIVWNGEPVLRSGPLAGYADVVKIAAPSVVAVLIELPDQSVTPSGWGKGGAELLLSPELAEDAEFETGAIGSGIILSSDGYVLTSSHVVEHSQRIRVLVPGREKSEPARLVGIDPMTDIAVIKLDAEALPVATLAKSSDLAVGDVVLTIGNPFGLEHTVTSGIISALGRKNLVGNPFQNLIQTDAPINPGSSGGALVDNRGRVIGITAAMVADGGHSAGVGFAEPIESAVEVAKKLISNGSVTRGYFGVHFSQLNTALAGVFGVSSTDGAVVADVASGSPGEQAGLQAGDVIVGFDSVAIVGPLQLEKLIAQSAPGAEVVLGFIRYGDSRSTRLRVGAMPGDSERNRAEVAEAGDSIINGVVFAELDPGARTYFGVPPEISGIVVVEIDPLSAAGRAGIEEGDVILQIGREPIASLGQAVVARDKIEGSKLLLRVLGWQGIKFTLLEEEID
ncbi:MAG: serine protease Do [Verrucomicrobiales bacterium]|jgi:serine protease Do